MKVLVVVDMQNDFIDGVLGTLEAQAIVPKVVDKIREYEGTDTLLVFTKDTHYENYLERWKDDSGIYSKRNSR